MDVTVKPLSMKEAIKYWESKIQLDPDDFAALGNAAKTKAFAVAGITKGGQLETVYNALGRAIKKGTTFEDFKKDTKRVFQRNGWTGSQPWRLDNIFRTNVQTAYNVGRFAQMKKVVDDRPYWMYDAVNDRRSRPTHRALDQRVFPADHGFWDSWYPPNGFRCRCTVQSLSERQVKKRGIKVGRKDPTGGLIEPIDPKTGNKTAAVPLLPDRGFKTNVGKNEFGFIGGDTKTKGKWKQMPGLKTAKDLKRSHIKDVADLPKSPAKLLPGGESDDFYINEFKKLYGDEKMLVDKVGEPVLLSLRSFVRNKQQGAAKGNFKFEKPGHGELIPLVEDIVTDPFEIWLTPMVDDNGRVKLVKRYIGLWRGESDSVGGFSVFEVNKGMFEGVTAFLPFDSSGKPNFNYLEKQRKGLLLYGR